MIGSLDELYSVDVMLNSALIKSAESENERYAKGVRDGEIEKALAEKNLSSERKAEIEKRYRDNVRAFYSYDYNFRSSLSRIIHERKCLELGIKSPSLEHRRWNAYMRSEGYRYSGSADTSSRNDLGKLHHNLVPYAELCVTDAKKDL